MNFNYKNLNEENLEIRLIKFYKGENYKNINMKLFNFIFFDL